MSDSELPALGPRYQLLELLGEDGPTRVYLAHDRDLERRVTLRLVHQRGASEPFLEEARAMARLDHPGLVPILDLGETDAGALYCTMPVVQGQSLRHLLDELRTGGDAARRA